MYLLVISLFYDAANLDENEEEPFFYLIFTQT